jgi:predicted DCC family thiol-disulfide oxidoreductase YuxK
MAVARPTLVFYGDCAICRSYVSYWQQLTNGRVVYRPYQDAAADFPAISREAFQRAIWLIEPDGQAYSAAAATYRVLLYARGRAGWWWMYRRVPGFAAASEWAYRLFARRRDLLSHASRLLWGPVLEPEHHRLLSFTFLRLFGAIYIAAFASVGVQVLGLMGHAGILPLGDYLSAARQGWGTAAYWRLPTLFWLDSSDTLLVAATVIGVLLGLLVALGVLVRPALIGAFMLYLSFVYAGQVFMNFQWDLLLLESGFLAIFLTGGSRIVVWLYRWLVFRFLFLAGAMKLISGDPSWRNLTTLDYHFWTQPLPTPLAWYAAKLPHGVLTGATAATLIIELGLVFLIFLPRRPRAVAAGGVLLLQLMILLTGNYNFFNLLTMLLCLFLLDDAALRRLVPVRLASHVQVHAPRPGRAATAVASALALIVVPVGLDRIWQPLTNTNLPLAGALAQAVSPLLIVNPYGLFITTTTTRPEIVIEGSEDGQIWSEYVFRYKPGPVARSPRWNIPHQPRLDWQMWFAAYGAVVEHRWFERLMQELLNGSPSVQALLATDPFPDRPPKYLRALLYDYRFTDADTYARTQQWWTRRLAGLYFPQVSLVDFSRSIPAETARPLPGMPGGRR